MAVSLSYYVGATLLVGSGFLAAYTLVSRSELLLGMERGFAIRLALLDVFAFLTVAAAGSVASILVWQEGTFSTLIARMDQTDLLVRMLSVDMEAFYLARPLFLTIFAALALASVLALFREDLVLVVRWIIRRLKIGKRPLESDASPGPSPQSRNKNAFRRWGPYLILVASVVLGIAITTHAYTAGKVDRLVGSDMWFYDERLSAMMKASNPLSMLEADRALFILVLYLIMASTRLEPQTVLMLAPALCAALLAVSAFALVKEGTDRPWLAGFAALLSVVSAQTSLGMGAGILANWFSLSIANFMFALVLRWIRLKSRVAGAGSVLLSPVLLGSYTYTWVAAAAMLAVALIATFLGFPSQARDQWKHESLSLAAGLAGNLILPFMLAYLIKIPLLGNVPTWLNPSAWLSVGWNYLVGMPSSQVLASAPAALEQAFDFAGNRIDLPFLTILSIVGLLDSIWARSFRRIVAAMITVSIFLAVVSPDLYLTWRGLFMIPTYLAGALGAESIIRRVNGQGRSRVSPSRVAFAGILAAYVFLTHLSYSLRALELLILATIYT
jgi:hypothetical protein